MGLPLNRPIHICTRMYTFIYISIFTLIHISMLLHTFTHINEFIYIYLFIYINPSIRSYLRIIIHTIQYNTKPKQTQYHTPQHTKLTPTITPQRTKDRTHTHTHLVPSLNTQSQHNNQLFFFTTQQSHSQPTFVYVSRGSGPSLSGRLSAERMISFRSLVLTVYLTRTRSSPRPHPPPGMREGKIVVLSLVWLV